MQIGPRLRKLIFQFKIKYLKPKLYRTSLENEQLQESGNLLDINFKKRKALVQHAIKNSVFYREKYAELQIDLSKLSCEEEFKRLPILTREELRDNFSKLVANSPKKEKFNKFYTSGSTGPAISVLQDTRRPLLPTQWRILKWWGIQPYENKAFVYRYPRTNLNTILNALIWWPTKRIFLTGSEMNHQNMNKFLVKFNRNKPTLLQGYVDLVYDFALYLKDHNLKIHSPKAVWVTSGPLSKQQRSTMQQVFKAPVYDQYGSTEIMYVSAECKEQNGLHIMQDLVHIECVDENNRNVPFNKWGKILLTDLHNYAFPLIRYEIGDYGRLLEKKCSCGLPFPLMDQVSGRLTDVIQTPSGIQLYGHYLNTIFDEFPEKIREYQIFQTKNYSVQLLYVPMNKEEIGAIISNVISNLKQKLNFEIDIKAIMVSKIEPINGKTPLIINHLILRKNNILIDKNEF
tara:strand:+ start:6360 stop:7733 length:1374 start_codon:yes stop_codon:yes gene_type:complete